MMLGTVLRTSWIEFSRDRPAQMLSFILPIAFFTVFAVIFGGMDSSDAMSKIKVAVADEDHSEASTRIIRWLNDEGTMQIVATKEVEDEAGGIVDRKLSREEAIGMVKGGKLSVAMIFPKGFGDSIALFGGGIGGGNDSDGEAVAIELFVDRSDPIATQAVSGLLQGAVMSALPDMVMSSGIDQFAKYAGPLTGQQKTMVDEWLPSLREEAEKGEGKGEDGSAAGGMGMGQMVPVEVHDALVDEDAGQGEVSSIVAFYAAGTVVLFLLFTVVGSASVLLDYEESGVLERLLSSKLSMSQLIYGRWIFITFIGFVQVFLMFLWGWAVFGIELWTVNHFVGFMIMATVTAASAASFGMVFAAAAKSRAQLHGLSTVVILIMSAVGGSMVPRFMMPEAMQKVGLITFNAWALDGFRKVFWYQAGVMELWPQVGVLVGLTVVFLWMSRRLARRWETA